MAKRDRSTVARDDGLTIRKWRVRHDEREPPRGHTLDGAGWPIALPPKGARAATDGDTRLVRALIDRLRWLIDEGDAPGFHAWPTRFDDEIRSRIERAYLLIAGYPFTDKATELDERRFEEALATRLRHREELRLHARARGADDDATYGGNAIVDDLCSAFRRHPDYDHIPSWLDLGALARAVDATDGHVNLGGKGGRNRGKTAEAWARAIMKRLRAANSTR